MHAAPTSRTLRHATPSSIASVRAQLALIRSLTDEIERQLGNGDASCAEPVAAQLSEEAEHLLRSLASGEP
jgi:hypothetical protein